MHRYGKNFFFDQNRCLKNNGKYSDLHKQDNFYSPYWKNVSKIISCNDIGRQAFFPINIKQTAQWILITKCFRFYNYTFLCEHNIMLALHLYEKKYFGIFISSKSHFGCWHMHMAPTRKPKIGPPALGPASSCFIFISL